MHYGVFTCARLVIIAGLLWSHVSLQPLRAQECRPLGNPSELPVLAKKGDVVLGGLFSLHDTVLENALSFTSPPAPAQCSGLVKSNYKSPLSFLTALFSVCICVKLFYMKLYSKMSRECFVKVNMRCVKNVLEKICLGSQH